MRKVSIIFMLLFSLSGFALDIAKDDLSGAWRLNGKTDEGKKFQYDMILLKTGYKFGTEQVDYYQVLADTVLNMKMVGLRVVPTAGGKFRLNWIRFASPNPDSEGDVPLGTRLDGESSLVLKIEGDTLILGGDYEQYEVGRLTRLPYMSQ